MKYLKISLLLITFSLFAQSEGQDSVTFESAYSWVERKITFNYFDSTNQHWWVNRIQGNMDGTYTIKNIAAKHPLKVLEKVYHNRTLFLWNLNPNTISIIELKSDQGRFVKGKIIRAECFTGQKDIRVIKDGRSGSKVGFIHISVPEILEDSVEDYSSLFAQKLSETIYLNARLFNTSNVEDNITSAFKAFRGLYTNSDKSAFIDFEVMDVGLVRFTLKQDNKTSYGTIGYDEEKDAVYFFLAGNKDYLLRDLKFDDAIPELILDSNGDTIHVIGRNTIQFNLPDLKGRFERY